MPVKVAYIVEYPTPYDVPLFERIAKRPEVDFTALFLSETISQRGWKVDPAGRFPHKTIRGGRLFVSSNTQFTAFFNPGVFRELVRGNYDVVGTSGYIPVTHYAVLAWCKAKGIPHFVRSEAVLPHARSDLKRAIKSVYLPYAVKTADSWLAAGTLAKKYLVHYGADPEKVFFLNYTIDDDAFETAVFEAREKRDQMKRDLNITARSVVLFCGRLAPMKGLDTLMDAFAAVKRNGRDAALAFLGSGPLEAHLKKRVERESISDVHFLGFHQADELPAFYGMADMLVLPSVYEPWGIVVNEAQAASLPVVASDVCGAAEDLVVDGETGFRFRSGDAKHLAECIERVLENDALRAKMGASGRKMVKDWGFDRSVDGFVKATLTAAGQSVKK